MFELMLADGKHIVWEGTDGEDAARRYVDCCGGTVIAWRNYPRHGLFVGAPEREA
jgi:hypothetical protein